MRFPWVSSRRYILFGIATLTILLLAFTLYQPGQLAYSSSSYGASVEQLWLEAEAEQDVMLAPAKWEKLATFIASHKKGGNSDNPADNVSKMLFTAYLKAIQVNSDLSFTAKALNVTNSWNKADKIWAYLLLAKVLENTDHKQAWKLIKLAANIAGDIPERKLRSYSLHAVISSALTINKKQLVFSWDGLQLAHQLIPKLTTSWHRADAMRQFSLVSPKPENVSTRTLHLIIGLPFSQSEKRNKALLQFHTKARSSELFYPALDALSAIADSKLQQGLLYQWFTELVASKEFSRAIAVVERLDDERPAAIAWSKLALHYARSGLTQQARSARKRSYAAACATHYPQERMKALAEAATYIAKSGDFLLADKMISLITDSKLNAKSKASIKSWKNKKPLQSGQKTPYPISADNQQVAKKASLLVQQGDIQQATQLLRQIKRSPQRAWWFRQLAELQAQHTDYYHLLGKNEITQFLKPPPGNLSNPASVEKNKLSPSSFHNVQIRPLPPSSLGRKFPSISESEALSHTARSLRETLPLPSSFRLQRAYYENSGFLNTKFKMAIRHADAVIAKNTLTPQILFLEQGTATLPQLYDAVHALDQTDLITRKGQNYTLNRALVIGPAAGLIIDQDEVNNLYLSKSHAGIIINAGTLYITGVSVIGWDETISSPAFATYKQRYDFRPFIASWSGSHTYLGGSQFTALGYNNHKSYGVSFSSGPEKRQAMALKQPPAPDGVIVENSFHNMYYGFYSYEAENVALIGNEYENSIIYGIDPHDRSQHLTIAYNTTYGSQKKHGIIISREVNNSSYIGNLSFSNKGSGFMVDRLSHGTYIYGNTAFRNQQDGLTLFESGCNLVASNYFFSNDSMGVRIRNSRENALFTNRIQHNKEAAIYGYSMDLTLSLAHKNRNFRLDPFTTTTTMTLVGNYLAENGAGLVAENLTAITWWNNIFEQQAPHGVKGEWFSQIPYFLSQYSESSTPVILYKICPAPTWQEMKCRFRTNTAFEGDGQNDLLRILQQASSCQFSSQKAKH